MRSILLCGRPYCAEGFDPAAICPAHERWRSRSLCPEIPSTRRWTSSRSKVICCVAAGHAGGAIRSSDDCPDITGPGRQADKTCRPAARACAARHSGDGVYAGNACHQLFPLAAVAAVVRSRPARGGSALLGYGDPAGEPTLRAAIARHLALSRGIDCDASQIVITEGALEGVNLCTMLLSEPGMSPGWKIPAIAAPKALCQNRPGDDRHTGG